MIFVVLLAVMVVLAACRTVALVRLDGLGHRPPPRSHAAETAGSTWPQHGESQHEEGQRS